MRFCYPFAKIGSAMDINKYLSDHLIYKQDFCKILNISRCHLSQICNYKKIPSYKLIRRIEAETNGKVTAKDWRRQAKDSLPAKEQT